MLIFYLFFVHQPLWTICETHNKMTFYKSTILTCFQMHVLQLNSFTTKPLVVLFSLKFNSLTIHNMFQVCYPSAFHVVHIFSEHSEFLSLSASHRASIPLWNSIGRGANWLQNELFQCSQQASQFPSIHFYVSFSHRAAT